MSVTRIVEETVGDGSLEIILNRYDDNTFHYILRNKRSKKTVEERKARYRPQYAKKAVAGAIGLGTVGLTVYLADKGLAKEAIAAAMGGLTVSLGAFGVATRLERDVNKEYFSLRAYVDKKLKEYQERK